MKGTLNGVAMAMLLASINQQLSRLEGLSLKPHQRWAGEAIAWQQLGCATHLSKLQIVFQGGVHDSSQLADVVQLRALKQLQHLNISPPKAQADVGQRRLDEYTNSGLSMAFLGELTALTYLQLAVYTSNGMCSISSCRALRELSLRHPGYSVQLQDDAWAAVGTLPALTSLYLGRDLCSGHMPALYSALGSLTTLVSVVIDGWTPAALPVLANLPQLSWLTGRWVAGDGGAAAGGGDDVIVIDAALTCPHVTRLSGVSGPVPWDCFVNLQSVQLGGRMDGPAWAVLAGSCPHLHTISGTFYNKRTQRPGWSSLVQPEGGGVAHVTALHCLSQATKLRKLCYCPATDAELFVLAQAVPQLRCLHIALPPASQVTCAGLMALAKLPCLTHVILDLWSVWCEQGSMEALLCSLSDVPDLVLGVSRAGSSLVRSAADRLAALGVRTPATLTIETLGSQVVAL